MAHQSKKREVKLLPLAIGMLLLFSVKKCVLAYVCYSFAKCCCKIKENEKDEDAISFYIKVFNGSME